MNSFANLFWQAYLVNFLFWTSLAQGAVVFAAALDLSNARWGRRYVQISRYFAGFLPVCVLLFAGLLLGRNHIFPWIAEPIPEKAAYLNVPFLAVRDLIGLAVLAVLSLVFLHKTRDSNAAAGPEVSSPWSVALVIAFMIVYTYLAFDLVMSLRPTWYSTLLGGYYAVSALYLGIAGLCLVGCLGRAIPGEDLRKISKLLFASALFWVSLLWSQYIVIWYGDKPDETEFIYPIFYHMPWKVVTYAVLAAAFALPFLALMSRRAKLANTVPMLASACIVVGLMLEKYILVVPSFEPDRLNIGWVHLLVTLAFAAIFAISYQASARLISPTET